MGTTGFECKDGENGKGGGKWGVLGANCMVLGKKIGIEKKLSFSFDLQSRGVIIISIPYEAKANLQNQRLCPCTILDP